MSSGPGKCHPQVAFQSEDPALTNGHPQMFDRLIQTAELPAAHAKDPVGKEKVWRYLEILQSKRDGIVIPPGDVKRASHIAVQRLIKRVKLKGDAAVLERLVKPTGCREMRSI